ncbi:hypothetical protein HDU86_001634 [Geranomyces michiganensis]|nr:hypothetical protein HDU86_001634 [Geranomyces michiganensis]
MTHAGNSKRRGAHRVSSRPVAKGDLKKAVEERIPSFKTSFDEFTYYVMERERISIRRRIAGNETVTANPVLRNFHFCNNRREDDRTSIAMREVFAGRSRYHPRYLWNCVFHRMLSKGKVNTAFGFVENLEVAVRKLTQWNKIDAKEKANTEKKWRHCAFTFCVSFDQIIKDMRVNWIISPEAGRALFGTPDDPLTPSFEETCATMSQFNGVGPFHTVQTSLDLVMYPAAGVALPRQIDPGPGAVKALELFSYDTSSDKARRRAVTDVTTALNQALKKHHAKMADTDVLFGKALHMRLHDTEHALCEYQKYVSAAGHFRRRTKNYNPRRYVAFKLQHNAFVLGAGDAAELDEDRDHVDDDEITVIVISDNDDDDSSVSRSPHRRNPSRICTTRQRRKLQYSDSNDSDVESDLIISSIKPPAAPISTGCAILLSGFLPMTMLSDSTNKNYLGSRSPHRQNPSRICTTRQRRKWQYSDSDDSDAENKNDKDLMITSIKPPAAPISPLAHESSHRTVVPDNDDDDYSAFRSPRRQNPSRICTTTRQRKWQDSDCDDGDVENENNKDLIITSIRSPAAPISPVCAILAPESSPPPAAEDIGEGVYHIERLLQQRMSRLTGDTEYRVLWRGYPEADATWEPRSSLEDTQALEVWERKHYRKNGKRKKQKL